MLSFLVFINTFLKNCIRAPIQKISQNYVLQKSNQWDMFATNNFNETSITNFLCIGDNLLLLGRF